MIWFMGICLGEGIGTVISGLSEGCWSGEVSVSVWLRIRFISDSPGGGEKEMVNTRCFICLHWRERDAPRLLRARWYVKVTFDEAIDGWMACGIGQ